MAERTISQSPWRKPVLLFQTPLGKGFLSLALAALLWEFVARVVIDDPIFFVSLGAIARRAVELLQTGELQRHMQVSGIEFVVGFGAATAIGIGFGVLMSISKLARTIFEPWVSMLYATPVLAVAPLFILWLGIGVMSKIAIIYLTAVFPIIISTMVGLTTTDRNLMEVARSFGSGTWQVYRKIKIPAALPFIITGLRLGVARALVGVVVAELFGARAGLGFMILTSAQTFDAAALFVGVFTLAFAGVASVELLKWIERRLAPWRFQEQGE